MRNFRCESEDSCNCSYCKCCDYEFFIHDQKASFSFNLIFISHGSSKPRLSFYFGFISSFTRQVKYFFRRLVSAGYRADNQTEKESRTARYCHISVSVVMVTIVAGRSLISASGSSTAGSSGRHGRYGCSEEHSGNCDAAR